jgi:formylmethanofuran dehydrogenase subunit E
MLNEKKRRISAIGILTHNIIAIDHQIVEWVDLKDTSLAALAKVIGVDSEHMEKVNITIEVVEQSCELCGAIATGDQLCQTCGKLVCDKCAKIDATGRYCPICFDLRNSIEKPI